MSEIVIVLNRLEYPKCEGRPVQGPVLGLVENPLIFLGLVLGQGRPFVRVLHTGQESRAFDGGRVRR